MASTTWDEALDAERPVTEQDIRAWIEGREKLETTLNEYIRARNTIDPEFKCSTVGESYDGAEAEFGSRYVEVTWTWYGRCGSTEEEHRAIPLEHLWSDNWEAAIHADVERKRLEKLDREERAKAVKEAEAEKKRKDNEAHEIATFKRLQAKYGVGS
jgi:hypothetical protein